MISPYRIVAEDETTITYEYNSAFTWVLYGILTILLFGMMTENGTFEFIGAVLILVYFGIKLLGAKAHLPT